MGAWAHGRTRTHEHTHAPSSPPSSAAHFLLREDFICSVAGGAVQDAPLSPAATVATLVVLDPNSFLPTHEVWVWRCHSVVHIYRLISHGRRFYRTLAYSSDSRFCLRELQPSISPRSSPWPAWARYVCAGGGVAKGMRVWDLYAPCQWPFAGAGMRLETPTPALSSRSPSSSPGAGIAHPTSREAPKCSFPAASWKASSPPLSWM
jgi:hypothetical protein